MATLKEHQAAMVDLLANGSGIPASASRLAHAMHDVLVYMADGRNVPLSSVTGVEVVTYRPVVECGEGGLPERPFFKREQETTPGLNDRALSKPQKALKTDSPAKWPTPAEQRVKELENTIRQLKANNAKLRAERAELKDMLGVDPAYYRVSEQAGCRKEDTQVCEHDYARVCDLGQFTGVLRCIKCGATKQ